MSSSLYLDKAYKPTTEKPWALYIREWDGIDKPEHSTITTLTTEQAKAIERTEQVRWANLPDWHKVALEEEQVKLQQRLNEIKQQLRK